MNSREVEKKLNLYPLNLKFYGKIILPNSEDVADETREFTQEDLDMLKKTIILRKLDVSIIDIKRLYKRARTLNEIVQRQLKTIEENMNELNGSKKLCKKIISENLTMESLDADKILDMIEKDEKKGKKYFDIEEDYIYEQSKVFDSMAKYKKYEKKLRKLQMLVLGGLLSFILIMFGTFCFFDMIIYGRLDMFENVSLTIIFAMVDWLIMQAYRTETKRDTPTVLAYVVNFILVIAAIGGYNYTKIISNENAPIDSNVLKMSVKKEIMDLTKEKYKDKDKKLVYAQGHKIVASEIKDEKIYAYVLVKFGTFEKVGKKQCKSVDITTEPITFVFYNVKNSWGIYDFDELKENELPEEHDIYQNVDYNHRYITQQINEYCK